MGQARRESSHQMLHPSLCHLLAGYLTVVANSKANAEKATTPPAIVRGPTSVRPVHGPGSCAIHDAFASSHQRCSLETPFQNHL